MEKTVFKSGLGVLFKKQRSLLFLTLLFRSLFDLFLVLFFKFLSSAIDSLIYFNGGSVLRSDFFKIMSVYLIVFFTTFILILIYYFLHFRLKRNARVNLQLFFLAQVNKLSLSGYLKDDLSKQQLLYTRLKNDTNQYVDGRVNNLYDILGAITSLLTTLVIIGITHWLILIVLIFLSSLMQLISSLFKRYFAKSQVDISKSNADFNNVTQNYLQNWELLYLNNKQHLIKSASREASIFKTKQSVRLWKLSNLNSFLNSFVSNLIFKITEVILLYLILSRLTTLTVGQVVLFTYLFTNTLPKINSIIKTVILDRSLRPIFDKFKLKLETDPKTNKGFKVNQVKEIKLTDLSLSYQEGDRNERLIFKDLNLTFKAGRRYAIVGQSGSGKSSLAKLLLGSRFDYGGKILLDGVELREVEEDSLRELFTFIGPDNFVFDDTLVANITLMEGVQEAATALEKANLLKEFPNWRENKTSALTLSEGQKQRVCLARGFFEDKQVIIMDESLANLDKENIRIIKDNILKDTNNKRIYIIISHHIDRDDLFFDEIIDLNSASKG